MENLPEIKDIEDLIEKLRRWKGNRDEKGLETRPLDEAIIYLVSYIVLIDKTIK